MRKHHTSSCFSVKQHRHVLSVPASRFILVPVAMLGVGLSLTKNCLAADFTDVPAGGISYWNTVDTVNIGGGSAVTSIVNPGTIGIQLVKTGVNGTSSAVAVTYSMIKFDDDQNSNTPSIDVVSLDGTKPYEVDGIAGNYIIVKSYDVKGKPSAFSIGNSSDI